MHRPENREANILVKVDAELENEAAFGALGAHLGGALKDRIPVIEGLPGLEEANLKQLGAAMASTGMTPMFHPCRSCPKESRRLETVNVGREDLGEAIESLSTTHERPDMVFLGCPHCSFQEISQIAEHIKGRKVKKDIKFWVCTSRYVRQKAENQVNVIEEAGGKVVCDTCAVVTWIRDLGVNTLMTNSAKTAHYAPTMNKVKVRFAPLTQCVKEASFQ